MAVLPFVHVLLTVLGLVVFASANTDIVNLRVSRALSPHPPTSLIDEWTTLDASTNERLFVVDPVPPGSRLEGICPRGSNRCPHEAWVVLDFDDPAWSRFDAFTVRVSSPASSYVNIILTAYTPMELMSYFTEFAFNKNDVSTRRQYVRIGVEYAGLARSSFLADHLPPARFIVTVEPLYLGVVPASVLPLALSIGPLLFFAFWFATRIVWPWLDVFVTSAKDDVHMIMKKDH